MGRDKKPHEVFAQTIIDLLAKGGAPWQKPWRAGELSAPRNPVSGTVYRGVNRVILAARGFSDPRWLSLKQANSQGWRVKTGSESQVIEHWQWTERVQAADEDGRPLYDDFGKPLMADVPLERPRVRFFNVFHAGQIQTMAGEELPPFESPQTVWESDARSEAILVNSGARIYHDQSDAAYYTLSRDEIHLPPKDNFDEASLYYATALHELGHWTRHPSRLNRDGGPFGSPEYAREELRAEIASWMLAQDLGLAFDPGQHTAYVQNWITALQKDSFEIVRAARDAEKIKSYLLGLELAKSRGEPFVFTDLEPGEVLFEPQPGAEAPVEVFQVDPVQAALVQAALVQAAPVQATPVQVEAAEAVTITTAPAQATPVQPWYEELRWPKEHQPQFSDLLELTTETAEHDDLLALDRKYEWAVEAVKSLMDMPAEEEPDLGWYQSVLPKMILDVAGLHEKMLELGLLPPDTKFPFEEILAQRPKDPVLAAEKTWLKVPYAEKSKAKAAGAKWDRTFKLWFAPAGSDLGPLSNWLVKEPKKLEIATLSPAEEFSRILAAAGFSLNGQPILDGSIQRVPLLGARSKDGAYCGYQDGRPNGWFKNHKTGLQGRWLYSGQVLTEKGKDALKIEDAERRAERERERRESYAAAGKTALTKFLAAAEKDLPVDGHPYLLAKGVKNYGLVVDDRGDLLIPGVNLEQSLIHDPFRTDGKRLGFFNTLQILQTITPDGKKYFSAGSRKTGAMFLINIKGFYELEELSGKTQPVLIAEGYATGAALHEASGLPVAVAFDAGNLQAVAEALQRKFPQAELIVCADDDHKLAENVGLVKAQEAALAVGGRVLAPPFTAEEKRQGLTDWNDLAQARGLAAAALTFNVQLSNPNRPAGRKAAVSQETGLQLF